MSMKYYIKIFVFAIYLFVASHTSAQKNLVPNWSFEEYYTCPTVYTRDCSLSPSIIPTLKDWYCAMTYESTPDYYNKCGTMASGYNNSYGFQLPHSGEGYLGGFMHPTNNPFNIEYIQCTLKDSLKPSVTYCVSYFINRADKSEYAISQHGAVFTNNEISEPSITLPKYLNLSPQVKTPWVILLQTPLIG